MYFVETSNRGAGGGPDASKAEGGQASGRGGRATGTT